MSHKKEVHTFDHVTTPADFSIEQEAEKRAGGLRGPWIRKEWALAITSTALLMVALWLDYITTPYWFSGSLRLGGYALAYLPVALPVLVRATELAWKGEVFTEFTLMGIATIGAFYIGEYPEGVAVMLFYSIGELFQGAAVNNAKRSIKALLDVRPETATVLRNDKFLLVHPAAVQVNETIQVRAGERVPLDGTLLTDESVFNTSALTGESKPVTIFKGGNVLAGMINESRVVAIKVSRIFEESSLARILSLVQNAQGRKAKTELFIRRFARVYTPVVVLLAVVLTFMPYFLVDDYNFNEWLYRALIFLVISCPCALVVAIPLGYFGGIGAGSRMGILFKGSSYLDRITRVDTVVFDKTGTLTKGVFRVRRVVSEGMAAEEWMPALSSIEAHSSHPIARAIIGHAGVPAVSAQGVHEIRGRGIAGRVGDLEISAGNADLMKDLGIPVESPGDSDETIVWVSVNRKLAGYLTISDEIREDARHAVDQLHALHIRTAMLSGDRQPAVNAVAAALKIDDAFGDLLPERKVELVDAMKKERGGVLAFVGDGINDAPVLAISDVGVAMGGLGSDAAIETADVVIQTDQPSRIVTAIRIGKATNNIIWQNIALAFGVKVIVLALGAFGVASMWEAVFADVGVALLAILNAVRVQRMKF